MRLFLVHDTVTVSGAAALLGVGRSTAHRVLSTLEGGGSPCAIPRGGDTRPDPNCCAWAARRDSARRSGRGGARSWTTRYGGPGRPWRARRWWRTVSSSPTAASPDSRCG
nr:hypothetical protein [Streptomyces sp. SID4941]